MSLNKKQEPSKGEEKIEIAKRIAEQSQRMVKTYNVIEQFIMKIIRFFSMWFDRLLFNSQNGKVVTLVLAIVLYVVINLNIGEAIFNNPVQSGYTIDSIPITVIANDAVYEISGLPQSVKAYVIGDMSDISLIRTQQAYSVVADLTGLLEGTHKVNLIPKDFSSRVDVALSQSSAVVTIKKKISQRFSLSYDFVNIERMNQEYVLGIPVLENAEVIIRASQDTLNQIGLVKALIDTSGVSSSFTQASTIIAYDQNGNKMNVDILPKTVKVTVDVTSPSKSVPLALIPSGDIPNNLAIESVTFDNQTIMIFGPDGILGAIDTINVPVDVSALTVDSTIVADIPLPSGIRKTSVNVVTMNIKLGPAVNKQIDDVIIEYRNNINGYKFDATVAKVSVILKGTTTNVDSVSTEDIYVYFDMKNVGLGEQEVPLYIVGSNNLVKYTLLTPTIKIVVKKN
ncbi:MAG: CdaR family protein [Erysipelotrichaceae bacterium]